MGRFARWRARHWPAPCYPYARGRELNVVVRFDEPRRLRHFAEPVATEWPELVAAWEADARAKAAS